MRITADYDILLPFDADSTVNAIRYPLPRGGEKRFDDTDDTDGKGYLLETEEMKESIYVLFYPLWMQTHPLPSVPSVSLKRHLE